MSRNDNDDNKKEVQTVALKTETSTKKLQPSRSQKKLEDEKSSNNDSSRPAPPSVMRRVSTMMITDKLRWFSDDYITKDPLGEPGTFGMAFSCIQKDDPKQTLYAVKQINKAKFYHIEKKARIEIMQNMKNEIEVMSGLDHEGIVQLHEVYEDRNYIYLVMDYLSGGELFNRIQEQDLSEATAANITKQLLEALSYMQANNICHLDLKPDNIMFASKNSDIIKIIDFGMAQVVPRLKKMQQTVGTPYYTAPEVLNGEYDRAADVWSVGVILFCMLFGFPPFYVDQDVLTTGQKEEDAIFALIKKGFIPEVRDEYGPWFPSEIPVSAESRDLIAGMLQFKIADRMTVSECLAHAWIRGEANDKRLPKTVFDSLVNFTGTCRFKVLVSKMFARHLDPTRYAQTMEVFKKWDTDGDGEITLEEFKKGMFETTDLTDQEISEIFKNLDQDDSRTITIDELVVSAAFNALVSVDERMYQAFCELDQNGDGTLELEELKKVIEDNGDMKEIQHIDSIIEEIDINGDGRIDYEEFLHALHPQYNETKSKDISRIKSRGYGSFDKEQFQTFLKTTGKEELINYHYNPTAMKSNFREFQKKQTQSQRKLTDVQEIDEGGMSDEDIVNAGKNNENDGYKAIDQDSTTPPFTPKTKQKKGIEVQRVRPSDDLAKYDNRKSGCECPCNCVVL